MNKSKRQQGVTLIEVTVASTILLSVLVAMTMSLFNLSRVSTRERDRAFAAQKAVQMMEEMRSIVQSGGQTAVDQLDKLSDLTTSYQTVLTTDPNSVTPPAPLPVNPADPLSGNVKAGNNWKYLRQIIIGRSATQGARNVAVRIFYADPLSPAKPLSGPPLAEVAAVIFPGITAGNFPTQVYDIYALTLNNVPGWWADLNYLKNAFNSSLNDLQTRNVGLQARTHFITRLAYGRDPYYAPYINSSNTTNTDTKLNWAYFYPGKILNRFSLPTTTTSYYVQSDLDSDKDRLLEDGALSNGWGVTAGIVTANGGLSLADQFNNAVRYPDEWATWNRLATEAALNGLPAPEPTLRMLLEDLNNGVSLNYRNALLLNLHGELLPVVPIRNYSDPAKDPAGLRGIRLVAHPENLEYPANTTAVNLRVYAYRTNPVDGTMASTVPVSTIFIPTTAALGALPAGAVSVKKLSGNGTTAYTAATATAAGVGNLGAPLPNAAPNTDGPGGTGWDYRVELNPSFDDCSGQVIAGQPCGVIPHNGLLITLYNTPTTCPQEAASKTGLVAAKQLYNMEYIPNPIGTAGAPAFTPDLTTAGTGPKNTARWVVSFNPALLTGLGSRITFETRIGGALPVGPVTGVRNDGTAAGHPYNSLANVSRSYTWVGTSAPVTEQYQIMGDPRYNPYLDVQAGGRYNWFFNSSINGDLSYIDATDYPNFTKKQGIKWDHDDYDVANSLGFLREGLMTSNATFTSMTGYSFYYAGLGGEMGTDGNRTKFDIAGYPWNLGSKAISAVEGESNNQANEIIVDARLIARTDKGWFSMPWLGELYPDDAFATSWSVQGNLPAPAVAGASDALTYYRAPWYTSFTSGTIGTLSASPVNGRRLHRLSTQGCATFFNGSGGTRSVHFDHDGLTGTYGSLSKGLGTYLGQAFNLPLPASTDIYRPFSLSTTSGGAGSSFPPEWSDPGFVARGTQLTLLDGKTIQSDPDLYYYHDYSSWIGSAVVRVSGSKGRANIVVNGLAPQGASATSFLARYALSTVVQGFLSTGDYSATTAADANRSVQLPQLQIQTPKEGIQLNNPSAINVTWTTGWKRWDGQPYAPNVPSGWTEPTPLTYQLMYSADKGRTWLFDDGVTGKAGVPDPSHTFTSTSGAGTINCAGWAKGSYLFRVEAYRDGAGYKKHYSYHQREIWINR